ncbi:MAG: U32 family peptidase [Oscillospiraceae bacterium]|nr:U32 family peptidase [Oscillospiraceae bacterium]
MKKLIKKPEILAPAGSPETVLAALRCGANAVYVGAGYSARNDSVNFTLSQLQQAADLCHLYHAKLHLAVNTLLTDREFPEFAEFLKNAVRCGIDACIVQDLGILDYIHETVPDLPLHGSTQMSIHTPQGALQARELGCSRIVLARELSCDQIREIAELPVETEVFVHGALCMSVSGQCSFSAIAGGRSANRGQCAQACRLPWRTPSGENPAALSLKDLTLVEHVKTLQAMGVDSFKIEGRLKRPEYVAAAVTAFRMALDGRQPDLKLLESVFSRNGFTDGYFTDKKQNMFGFRRKEDVLAGQQVFCEIRETYRNPRKITDLDFDLELKAGTPAVLQVSDQDGNHVSIFGKIPEIAQNAPLRAETAEKYFRKLGNTIYEFHSIQFQNPDGLTLSASDCNAMRREAVEKLNHIRQKKINYQIRENSENSKKLENSEDSENFQIPRKRLHVRTMEQFRAVRESESEFILCVPMNLAEKLTPEQDIPVWVEAPRIIQNEKNYQIRLESLFAKGFRDLLCHNLADIRIGRRIGFTLHGGFGLNCTNSRTARSLVRQGLQDVALSYELRSRTIQEMRREIPCNCSAYLYGRIPMMLLRICPIRAQEKKCRHHRNCMLTDRTGRKFPLFCNPDYLELLNAEILFLGDKLEYFENLSYWDLYFTDETPEQLREIVQMYASNHSNYFNKNYTRGLYFKGGLR